MWPWEIHLTRFHQVFIRIPGEWGSSPDMLGLFTQSGVHSDNAMGNKIHTKKMKKISASEAHKVSHGFVLNAYVSKILNPLCF